MNNNLKGILCFLGITFGITYIVEFAMVAMGLRFESGLTALYGQYVVALAMWFPALAAWITAKWIVKDGTDRFGLRFGSLKPYLIWMAVMPTLFALVYGISWVLGLAQPDFQMTQFLALVASTGADMSTAPPPAAMVPILLVASIITAPIFNTIFALGEEIGWRGYLLPRLMPLGKPAAYSIGGTVWALWHLPLILAGFTYPGYPVLGIIAFILAVSALNVIENEMYLRNGRSTIIAAWIHSLFNSQKAGIWGLIFVGINPLIGGYAGIVGIVILWIVAIIVLRVQAARPAPADGTAMSGAPKAALGK